MKLSIVIPVFNSEKIINHTVEEIFKTLTDNYEFELILINDGSSDNSGEIIHQIAKENENVIAISLLKNYGQHTAILCGIKNSSGDYIINMDDDLQNPPSELPKMIQEIQKGYDLIFAKFYRKQHSGYRNIGSTLINKINKKIFNVPENITISNFRIYTKEVAKRVSELNTTFPYIPGMLLMSANSIGNVETEHHKRSVGTSNYTFNRIFKLVFRLLFNFSNLPLYMMTVSGLIISIFSFLFGIIMIFKAILIGSEVKGWTSLIAIVSFFCGFIILFLGVIGEYIVRIMNQLLQVNPYQISKITKKEYER